MSYRMGSVQVSRLQLALIIGTPLAIGLGIYIYKRSSAPAATDKSEKTKATKEACKKPSLKEKPISLDGTGEDKELEQKKKALELESEKLSPLKEATMYKNEGNVCYRNGKFDEAISFYDKAIDKCPLENPGDLAIFYQNRAAAYEMLKKWARVKEDCSRSLEHNPRYSKAYFRRAKAYEATGELRECLEDVTATCILEMFQNNNTIMYADRILKATGREDAEKGMKEHVPVLPSQNFVKTFLSSFANDPIENMELPAEVIERSEGAPRGFIKAKLALKAERYEEVIGACTEEIESSESESSYTAEALLLRGTFHLISGAFSEAQQDFDALINNGDADKKLRCNALIKRASLNVQLSEKEKGLEDFRTAQALMPDNADAYHQMAQIYILLDELTEALELFEKAVKLAPNHPMAYIQKCYAEYRKALMSGDQIALMMVINEFKNAIEKFPDCVDCYSLMAQVLSDQQQFAQADQFYEKALKMAPKNAALYVHRGILVLQWTGDIDKALEMMQQALEVDDKCELAYETLGTVEVQRANLDKAVELFEKAIALAKSQTEMCHLYALRNAAQAQISVTRKLGIDMSTISALAQAGPGPQN